MRTEVKHLPNIPLPRRDRLADKQPPWLRLTTVQCVGVRRSAIGLLRASRASRQITPDTSWGKPRKKKRNLQNTESAPRAYFPSRPLNHLPCLDIDVSGKPGTGGFNRDSFIRINAWHTHRRYPSNRILNTWPTIMTTLGRKPPRSGPTESD